MSMALLEEAVEEAEEEVQNPITWGLIVAIVLAVLVVAGGIAIAIKIPSKNTPETRLIYCSVSLAVSVGALVMGIYANLDHAVGEDVYFVAILGLFAFALIWLYPKKFGYTFLLDIVLGLVLTLVVVFIAPYNLGWLPGLLMIVISLACFGYHVRRRINRDKYIKYQEDKLTAQDTPGAPSRQAAPTSKKELKQYMKDTAGKETRPSMSAEDMSYYYGTSSTPAEPEPEAQDTPAAPEAPRQEDKQDSTTDNTNTNKEDKQEGKDLDLEIDPFDNL